MSIRNRYLLVLAVIWGPCFLGATVCYALLLRPQLDHKKGLEAKVAHYKEQHARALQAAKEKNQGHLAAEVESLQRRIGQFVVSLAEAPDLAFKIGELANEAKLGSFGMRPAHRSGSDTLPHLEHVGQKHVDLAFSAGFWRFAAFLNALERHHPVLFVETFAINRPMEQHTEPQARMELAVLVEKPPGLTGGMQ